MFLEQAVTEPTYIAFSYTRKTSERVGRIFRKYNVNIAHKPTRILKTELSQLKDHRPVYERAGVVYNVW